MIGQTIHHYRIIEKIGQGGMGVVYKAEDTKLQRHVALKFLPLTATENSEAIDRFINEAQTASALDHANICTIYEIDETEEGQLFIAMAYYDGETLKRALVKGEMSVDQALDVALQTAEGLARAHEAGITHRDIKPDNIILTDREEVKIIDFGLAKLASQGRFTKTGATMGTMAYMSPEQLQGDEIDHRTDIWSLGVTLHEMLTGELPFRGEYEQAIMYSIVHEEPDELKSYRPDLSANFQIVLDRALAKEADERYQSVQVMINDLKGLSDTSLSESPQQALVSQTRKPSYLPDYQNDLFVSYAHIDDKPLSEGQQGWIDKFHQAMGVRLEQLLGSDTKIWRDDLAVRKKSATKRLTPFPSVAILISVVSPQYVKSALCVSEVKQFCELAEKDRGLWVDERARIFKAVKTYVPRDSQPVELQAIPDYEFFQYDPVSGRPQEFWPEFGPEMAKSFWAKLEDIAYDIYLMMEAIKSGKTTATGTMSLATKTVIYLAEATYDLSSSRDKIKRQLQQRGYAVIPDRPLPLNADELQKKIEADLELCSLSIHLIGENYGVVPEGETRSIAEIQHQLAVNRSRENGFARLIWMPPGLRTKDPRQTEFVEALTRGEDSQVGAELLQTSLGEFKTFLIDKMSEEPVGGQAPVAVDDVKRIYLQCDPKDLDATAPLEEYLFDEGFEIKLPAFEGDELAVFEAHKENLLVCDATIIYYGNTTDSWLSTKLADLQKIAGYGRTKPMKAKAVYLAAPETKHKQRFRTREAIAIKNFDDFAPEVLAPFLEAIRSGEER